MDKNNINLVGQDKPSSLTSKSTLPESPSIIRLSSTSPSPITPCKSVVSRKHKKKFKRYIPKSSIPGGSRFSKMELDESVLKNRGRGLSKFLSRSSENLSDSEKVNKETRSDINRSTMGKHKRNKALKHQEELSKADSINELNFNVDQNKLPINKKLTDPFKANRCQIFLKGSNPCSSQCKYIHKLPKEDGIICKYYYLYMMCDENSCVFLHTERSSEEERESYNDKVASKRCRSFMQTRKCSDLLCKYIHRLPREDGIYCLSQINSACLNEYKCIYLHKGSQNSFAESDDNNNNNDDRNNNNDDNRYTWKPNLSGFCTPEKISHKELDINFDKTLRDLEVSDEGNKESSSSSDEEPPLSFFQGVGSFLELLKGNKNSSINKEAADKDKIKSVNDNRSSNSKQTSERSSGRNNDYEQRCEERSNDRNISSSRSGKKHSYDNDEYNLSRNKVKENYNSGQCSLSEIARGYTEKTKEKFGDREKLREEESEASVSDGRESSAISDSDEGVGYDNHFPKKSKRKIIPFDGLGALKNLLMNAQERNKFDGAGTSKMPDTARDNPYYRNSVTFTTPLRNSCHGNGGVSRHYASPRNEQIVRRPVRITINKRFKDHIKAHITSQYSNSRQCGKNVGMNSRDKYRDTRVADDDNQLYERDKYRKNRVDDDDNQLYERDKYRDTRVADDDNQPYEREKYRDTRVANDDNQLYERDKYRDTRVADDDNQLYERDKYRDNSVAEDNNQSHEDNRRSREWSVKNRERKYMPYSKGLPATDDNGKYYRKKLAIQSNYSVPEDDDHEQLSGNPIWNKESDIPLQNNSKNVVTSSPGNGDDNEMLPWDEWEAQRERKIFQAVKDRNKMYYNRKASVENVEIITLSSSESDVETETPEPSHGKKTKETASLSSNLADGLDLCQDLSDSPYRNEQQGPSSENNIAAPNKGSSQDATKPKEYNGAVNKMDALNALSSVKIKRKSIAESAKMNLNRQEKSSSSEVVKNDDVELISLSDSDINEVELDSSKCIEEIRNKETEYEAHDRVERAVRQDWEVKKRTEDSRSVGCKIQDDKIPINKNIMEYVDKAKLSEIETQTSPKINKKSENSNVASKSKDILNDTMKSEAVKERENWFNKIAVSEPNKPLAEVIEVVIIDSDEEDDPPTLSKRSQLAHDVKQEAEELASSYMARSEDSSVKHVLDELNDSQLVRSLSKSFKDFSFIQDDIKEEININNNVPVISSESTQAINEKIDYAVNQSDVTLPDAPSTSSVKTESEQNFDQSHASVSTSDMIIKHEKDKTYLEVEPVVPDSTTDNIYEYIPDDSDILKEEPTLFENANKESSFFNADGTVYFQDSSNRDSSGSPNHASTSDICQDSAHASTSGICQDSVYASTHGICQDSLKKENVIDSSNSANEQINEQEHRDFTSRQVIDDDDSQSDVLLDFENISENLNYNIYIKPEHETLDLTIPSTNVDPICESIDHVVDSQHNHDKAYDKSNDTNEFASNTPLKIAINEDQTSVKLSDTSSSKNTESKSLKSLHDKNLKEKSLSLKFSRPTWYKIDKKLRKCSVQLETVDITKYGIQLNAVNTQNNITIVKPKPISDSMLFKSPKCSGGPKKEKQQISKEEKSDDEIFEISSEKEHECRSIILKSKRVKTVDHFCDSFKNKDCSTSEFKGIWIKESSKQKENSDKKSIGEMVDDDKLMKIKTFHSIFGDPSQVTAEEIPLISLIKKKKKTIPFGVAIQSDLVSDSKLKNIQKQKNLFKSKKPVFKVEKLEIDSKTSSISARNSNVHKIKVKSVKLHENSEITEIQGGKFTKEVIYGHAMSGASCSKLSPESCKGKKESSLHKISNKTQMILINESAKETVFAPKIKNIYSLKGKSSMASSRKSDEKNSAKRKRKQNEILTGRKRKKYLKSRSPEAQNKSCEFSNPCPNESEEAENSLVVEFDSDGSEDFHIIPYVKSSIKLKEEPPLDRSRPCPKSKRTFSSSSNSLL